MVCPKTSYLLKKIYKNKKVKSNVICVWKHYKFSRIDKNNILHKFGKFGFKISEKQIYIISYTQKGDCEQIWKIYH